MLRSTGVHIGTSIRTRVGTFIDQKWFPYRFGQILSFRQIHQKSLVFSSDHRRVCQRCGCVNVIRNTKCEYCNEKLDRNSIKRHPFDFVQQAAILRSGISSISIPDTTGRKMHQNGKNDQTDDQINDQTNTEIKDQVNVAVNVLSRNYHVIVTTHPYPKSAIHIVSIARDSKKPSLLRLSRADLHLCALLRYYGLSCLPSLLPSPLKSLKSDVLKYVLLGFSHPSPHSQLHLHILVPPITNFNIFETQQFIPFSKVIGLLENHGRLHSSMLQQNDCSYISDVVRCDEEVRRILQLKCS